MTRAELTKLGFQVNGSRVMRARDMAVSGASSGTKGKRTPSLVTLAKRASTRAQRSMIDFSRIRAVRTGDVLELVLPVIPRTNKNSKTDVRREKPAYRQFRSSVCTIVNTFHGRMNLPLPPRTYNCEARIYADTPMGDPVGYYQGLADALERAKVVGNDWQLRSWNGSEVYWCKENPRIELRLTPCENLMGWFPKRGNSEADA